MSIIDTIIIFILNLVPTFIILGIILHSDRKSKEPIPLLLMCILSGLLTTYMSISFQKIIMQSIEHVEGINIFKTNVFLQLILLAFIEEGCKLFILYIFFSHTKSFDDIYDGFVYSVIIALSFACIETILYAFKEENLTKMSIITLTRFLTSMPLHITCGTIMGHHIALERFSKKLKKKNMQLIEALLIPTFIHSLYNIILTYLALNVRNKNITSLTIMLFIIVMYFVTFRHIRKDILLNERFIKNKKYPEKYRFLLNKRQFSKKK